MLIRFEYKATPYLPINNICVIGSFNGFQPEKGVMKKKNGAWVFDMLLPEGEHRYKFLINYRIKLNDPNANLYRPDDSGELWSVILIDDKGQRLYNNEQYKITIEEYLLSGRIVEPEETNVTSRKHFNRTLDKMVVARFAFTEVTGIHEVTAFWFEPNGSLHSYSQRNLFSDEKDLDEPIHLWFWVPFDKIKGDGSAGLWTLKLFINGNYIMEDQMTISRSFPYQGYGNGYGLKRV